MSEPRIPEDAGEHAEGLRRILQRFDEDWPAIIYCGSGWYEILVRLDQQIEALSPDYRINQIKSKFGTLRFYAEYPEEDGTTGIWSNEHPYRGTTESEFSEWWSEFDRWSRTPEGLEAERRAAELNREITRLIDEAEERSSQTCEVCGEPGELRDDDGWYFTSCPEHSS